MTTDELREIVDADGREKVLSATGWSRYTLWRKLTGKSRITKAESELFRLRRMERGRQG